MLKGRLISRLGLLVSCMTLLGMGATWVLTSSGATGGTLWVGALVVAALVFPFGHLVGQKAFDAGPGPRQPAPIGCCRDGGSRRRQPEEDELSGLRKALEYITTYSQARVQALESERAKGTAILDSMTEGVIALDGQGYVVLMNPAARRMLDFAQDQGERRTLLEVVRDRGLADWVEMCQALDTTEPCKREIECYLPTLKIIAVNALPMPFLSERRGFLLVLHDITELRRLEKVRAEFVANVSHELRTPLTAIKGYLETVLDETMLESATHRRFLEIANSHAERMGRLINDLLNLSDIETGKVDPGPHSHQSWSLRAGNLGDF